MIDETGLILLEKPETMLKMKTVAADGGGTTARNTSLWAIRVANYESE